MLEDIKKNILNEINIYYNTIIKFLLILIIILQFNRTENTLIYIGLIVIIIIKIIINKKKIISVETKTTKKYNIIKISNNKRNKIHILYKNIFSCIMFPIYLMNLKTNITENIKKYIRTDSYNKSYSVIRYSLTSVLPDKCIIILNHTFIDNHDYLNISLLLLLFPNHKHIGITHNKSSNKLVKKTTYMGKILVDLYTIDNNNINAMYRDISNEIKNNDKVLIVIYPEGIIKRTTNIKNYEITADIENFNVIENKCFNYKKGAFVLALMNDIPIIQGIFYAPMPNYKYKYFDKEYDIKHINHIGVKLYNKYQSKKSFAFNKELTDNNIIDYIESNSKQIERFRYIMEEKFKKRYIETLVESHKFNISL